MNIQTVPPPRPASAQIILPDGTSSILLQGWFRSLWNMINGTLNKGYTGTQVISGVTYTYQNGVLIGVS